MNNVEWQRVKDVFYTALSRPLSERLDFLDSACGDNRALRSEVEVLLDSYESGFLESPLLAHTTAKSSNDPLFEPGRIFSHFEILKLLGRGGMGEVYLANDLTLDRLAAIKVIHADSGFGDQAAERLVREAKAAAKLDHPNICSVYEVGETEGQPFIAMQYVEGEMLDALIGKDSIVFDDAVTYTRQIAAALAEAHAYGIVHRDIKPSNIMIDQRNQVKVLDFGLATGARIDPADDDEGAGIIAGTLTYMSPEHVQGHDINEQTDIWSLGVVFYQMLTGRLPFRGKTKADLMRAIVNADVELLDDPAKPLSTATTHIFNRALQKDRAERYFNIQEFDADLAGLISVESVGVSPALTSHWFGRFALPVILLLALAVGGVWIWKSRTAGATAPAFVSDHTNAFVTTNLFSQKRGEGGAITDIGFSPDGTRIAYTLSGPMPSGVYVKAIAGGDAVRITDEAATAYSPIWSADGQQLAYLSVRDGSTALWSTPLTGGEPKLLVDLEKPGRYQLSKWGGDGKTIYFEFGEGPRTLDLETGNISVIDTSGVRGTISKGFSVSPDESRIFLISTEEGNRRLWLKVKGESGATPIRDVNEQNKTPSWFPDSRRYAYSSDRTGNFQIYISDLESPETKQVAGASSNSSQPVISPDGRKMVYVTNTDEANLFSTDISTQRETAITSDVHIQLLPSVSVDGEHIAYQSANDGTKLLSGELRIDSISKGKTEMVWTSDTPGCCSAWSPSGDALAYLKGSGSDLHLWLRETRDGTETRVAQSPVRMRGLEITPFGVQSNGFEWSPDGTKLVFVSAVSGADNLWVVDRNGSNERMLTSARDGASNHRSPSWAPDGKRIAFIESTGRPQGEAESRVALYQDGSVVYIAEFKSSISLLAWSKSQNGVYVAVPGPKYFDVYFVTADGSHKTNRLTQLPNARRIGIGISPDEKWISFTQSVDGANNLFIKPIGGGNEIRLTSNSDSTLFYSGVTWSPDSKALFYSKQTGGMQISLISQVGEETQ